MKRSEQFLLKYTAECGYFSENGYLAASGLTTAPLLTVPFLFRSFSDDIPASKEDFVYELKSFKIKMGSKVERLGRARFKGQF